MGKKYSMEFFRSSSSLLYRHKGDGKYLRCTKEQRKQSFSLWFKRGYWAELSMKISWNWFTRHQLHWLMSAEKTSTGFNEILGQFSVIDLDSWWKLKFLRTAFQQWVWRASLCIALLKSHSGCSGHTHMELLITCALRGKAQLRKYHAEKWWVISG